MSRVGWVNRRHARDSGVRAFWADLNARLDQARSFPVEVVYGQGMAGLYGPFRIATRVERRYSIHRSLTQAERKAAAWQIFQETSEAFEDLQGRWPNCLDRAAVHSSWREGDLAGNWIAFQTAVEGRSQTEVEADLGEADVASSLQRVKAQPPRKSRHWPVPMDYRSPGAEVEFLTEKRASWRVSWR